VNLHRSAIGVVAVVAIIAATGCASLHCVFNCNRLDEQRMQPRVLVGLDSGTRKECEILGACERKSEYDLQLYSTWKCR
jgi:hypothetical protein